MKKDKKNFLKELKEGLSKKNKTIPSKFHYDLLGSKYFEKITQQKEYYPTRKEKEILKKLSKRIPFLFSGDLSFVEIGSGAADKIKIFILSVAPLPISQKDKLPLNILGNFLLIFFNISFSFLVG